MTGRVLDQTGAALPGVTIDLLVNSRQLTAVTDEWFSTSSDYATRIAHLRGTTPGGLNGATLLGAMSSVLDDAAVDSMKGEAGSDWFFADTTVGLTKDLLVDRLLAEMLDDI